MRKGDKSEGILDTACIYYPSSLFCLGSRYPDRHSAAWRTAKISSRLLNKNILLIK